MAKKKEVYKVKPLNEDKKNIIAALIEEYDIETADDIQKALKDLLGGTIKSMMESEMDEHLGYESYERSDNDNYRNGTKRKTVRSNYGEFQIDVPHGLIEGVSVGSTKVTVTLGSVVKEITVNVTEAKTIKGVKITNVPNYYSIVVGSDPKQFKPEFKTAKLVFEDDTMSPEFSIDSEDYTIGEFSTETEGDIQIPVSVTAKGTKYDTTIAAKIYSYYDQEVYEVGVDRKSVV